MPECVEINTRGLLAVLRRDTSEELPVKGCRNDTWDGMLDLHEPHRAKAATAKDTTRWQAPHGLEEDYGVTICLPSFSRVAEAVPTRLCVEKMSGVVRRASVALSYSRDLVRVPCDRAMDKVCKVFCRRRSADEIDKAELMRILADAVKAGCVVLVSHEKEAV